MPLSAAALAKRDYRTSDFLRERPDELKCGTDGAGNLLKLTMSASGGPITGRCMGEEIKEKMMDCNSFTAGKSQYMYISY